MKPDNNYYTNPALAGVSNKVMQELKERGYVLFNPMFEVGDLVKKKGNSGYLYVVKKITEQGTITIRAIWDASIGLSLNISDREVTADSLQIIRWETLKTWVEEYDHT